MSARAAVIGLGSNLGSRAALLRASIDLLSACEGIEVRAVAPVRVTAPVGPPQPAYFNTAVLVHTELAPAALLAACLAVERRLHRTRTQRWGARTIDLDVLWIDGVTVHTATLDVPHPELLARGFALAPLIDLVPDARDPRDGTTLATHLARLEIVAPTFVLDHGEIANTDSPARGIVRIEAFDRADALARCSETLSERVVSRRTVQPVETREIEAALESPTRPDDERARRWLHEMLARIESERFAVRRVVLFEDSDACLRGALIGEPFDARRHRVARSAMGVMPHHIAAELAAPGRYCLRVGDDRAL